MTYVTSPLYKTFNLTHLYKSKPHFPPLFFFFINQVKHIEVLNLIIHLMKLVTMPTILYQPQERNTLSVNSTKITSTPIYHSMTFIKVKPRIKLITKKVYTLIFDNVYLATITCTHTDPWGNMHNAFVWWCLAPLSTTFQL